MTRLPARPGHASPDGCAAPATRRRCDRQRQALRPRSPTAARKRRRPAPRPFRRTIARQRRIQLCAALFGCQSRRCRAGSRLRRGSGVRPLRKRGGGLGGDDVAVSPKIRRRSAWPISTYRQPISASCAPLTSPVKAPLSVQNRSWPPTSTGVSAKMSSASMIYRNDGSTTSFTCPSRTAGCVRRCRQRLGTTGRSAVARSTS